jgi:hypothetical protein
MFFDCPRQHYGNAWHFTIDNDTIYYFELFCKQIGLRKSRKGSAVTPKTTKEEKLVKRRERKKALPKG